MGKPELEERIHPTIPELEVRLAAITRLGGKVGVMVDGTGRTLTPREVADFHGLLDKESLWKRLDLDNTKDPEKFREYGLATPRLNLALLRALEAAEGDG